MPITKFRLVHHGNLPQNVKMLMGEAGRRSVVPPGKITLWHTGWAVQGQSLGRCLGLVVATILSL